MNIYNKGFTCKLKENMSESLSGKDKATYNILFGKKVDYLIALKNIDDEHMLVTELSKKMKKRISHKYSITTQHIMLSVIILK